MITIFYKGEAREDLDSMKAIQRSDYVIEVDNSNATFKVLKDRTGVFMNEELPKDYLVGTIMGGAYYTKSRMENNGQ